MKKLLSFILVSLIISSLGFAQRNIKKPNVIIIMTDDQGNNLGCLGNPWLKTPNIDKFVNESVQLTNFHQAIMCTPSRTAMMTGKYSLRTGAWRTSVGRSNMRTEEVTIAEVFKENGYATGQFGKWHLGDTWPFRAQDQGFEETVNFKCGGISQISDYWGNDYFDDTYYHNGELKQYKGYCTDVFFNETIRYVNECNEEEKPFMIYLALNVAHLPAIVAEEYSKPWIEKGHPQKQAIYYGMISNLDENMGRLMSSLEEQGIKDNTIIVFTTDDGTAGYAAQFNENEWPTEQGFNMGQRGGKGSPYEGGHRLFSFFHFPNGQFNTNEVDDLTSVMDIFPTVMDICDVKTTQKLDQDGLSFKQALYGQPIVGNDGRQLFLVKLNPNQDVLFKRNKYCVIDGDWRWVSRSELYNVKDDRAQKNNLADKYPDRVKAMDDALLAWLDKNAADRETPVRFVLGDEQHPIISLTTQDLWEKSVFSQGHVQKLESGKGPWKVSFMNDGRYKVTLSRYPLYTGLAFNANTKGKNSNEFKANKAKLTIGKNTYEKEIEATDTHVTFKVNVKAGDTDLETWIYSAENITIPSYFVDVEYIK
ncbi:arylsulfatase [Carboxylicivirga marina]|uniref:Arylsulfatase n=1 Tax=Carboxylicivirga marina TaxID=2800988 RepID=A0ABS1HPK0_9BACT|nr:arylsulfatase [Carboxylicivirga marina]MBK3519472.1 arylsulfatase [Carboxylicivirga marina]